jgi:hypothetical protein
MSAHAGYAMAARRILEASEGRVGEATYGD